MHRTHAGMLQSSNTHSLFTPIEGNWPPCFVTPRTCNGGFLFESKHTQIGISCVQSPLSVCEARKNKAAQSDAGKPWQQRNLRELSTTQLCLYRKYMMTKCEVVKTGKFSSTFILSQSSHSGLSQQLPSAMKQKASNIKNTSGTKTVHIAGKKQ